MIFSKENIILDKSFASQDEVFIFLSKLAYDLAITKKSKTYYKALKKREQESTTGFEDGFAIPHGIAKDIKKPSLFFIRIANGGVEWASMDDKPAKYIFALAIPQEEVGSVHIDILSKIAVSLMKPEFQESIQNAQSVDEVFEAINIKITDKEKADE